MPIGWLLHIRLQLVRTRNWPWNCPWSPIQTPRKRICLKTCFLERVVSCENCWKLIAHQPNLRTLTSFPIFAILGGILHLNHNTALAVNHVTLPWRCLSLLRYCWFTPDALHSSIFLRQWYKTVLCLSWMIMEQKHLVRRIAFNDVLPNCEWNDS